jgi:hypothetical protein
LLPSAIITTFYVKPYRLKEATHALQGSVVSAANREPNFGFIAIMTSRQTNLCTVVTLWRTEEDTSNGGVPEGYSAALAELADMVEGDIGGFSHSTCTLRFLESHLIIYEGAY